MICAKAFPGWESFGALVSHLRFVKDHHRKIDRIAAVTDSEFLKIMPHVAKHFVSAEIRQFPSDERTQALAWIDADGSRYDQMSPAGAAERQTRGTLP